MKALELILTLVIVALVAPIMVIIGCVVATTLGVEQYVVDDIFNMAVQYSFLTFFFEV